MLRKRKKRKHVRRITLKAIQDTVAGMVYSHPSHKLTLDSTYAPKHSVKSGSHEIIQFYSNSSLLFMCCSTEHKLCVVKDFLGKLIYFL